MTRLLTHLGGARATILIGLLLATFGETAVGLAALVGNAISHLAVQLLKRTVARPRPCDAEGRPLALVELPDPFSFPSGHAAAAFAVATAVGVSHPWTAPLVLPLAAAIAWTRVALRVHYASDALAGAALGIAGAIASLQLLS